MPKNLELSLPLDFVQQLQKSIRGKLHTDSLSRKLYATDASIYRELPLGVVYPFDESDLVTLVKLCKAHNIPLIPRTAGTSLAGQCVGNGLVVDVSRHMTRIIHFDAITGRIRVQPGIVRDELNNWLKSSGWWFSPNTSTSNRCMIGGMVGNNSSGTTSVKYGVTRDKVKAIKCVLHDGTTHEFHSQKPFVPDNLHPSEKAILDLLNDAQFRNTLHQNMPEASIHRRNTGYALEVLAAANPFVAEGRDWNFAELLCGSEGTLGIFSEIEIQLDRLPPPHMLLVAIHFESIRACMEATVSVMESAPYACELMDKTILDCTKENLEQNENRFFVEGDPKAILVVELRGDSELHIQEQATQLINRLSALKLGYAFPIIPANRAAQVWSLRAAGLGLLANIPGTRKAIACIEDTAVALEALPNYISDFEALMAEFNQDAVYYAHAGAGEIHLRPILNLRDEKELQQFKEISARSAALVKKYRGSLSGEHGDGRVRAPFIEMMVGSEVYKAYQKVKAIFDPENLFNPGKIVNPKPLDSDLREDPSNQLKAIETAFDFGGATGFHQAAEKCNGSGDCRKSAETGGTMCPSYQATRDEKHSTRARANALREFIREGESGESSFAHSELKEVLDLCLSCKGCTRECPSNVDMTTMKSEWQYQYYQSHHRPLSQYLMGHIDKWAPIASKLAPLFRLPNRIPAIGHLLKRLIQVAPERNLPEFQSESLWKWFQKQQRKQKGKKAVYFFFDEFTNYQDVAVGKAAINLLWHLGYKVIGIKHAPSARGQLSKGLLKTAKKYAETNVSCFSDLVSGETPLLGTEPSAILGFRDEFPKLVSPSLREKAIALAKNTFLLEEFLFQEIRKGALSQTDFPQGAGEILLHGHCHQKALSSLRPTKKVLEAMGYQVRILPTGCCGMAGSFGYEAAHYNVSMQIGELVLFPELRKKTHNQKIVAIGTSCRHQIADGVGLEAMHWVSLSAFH
jgi:FAD/FMN-containing dehydrogenase/Fe-S oxidoreductase